MKDKDDEEMQRKIRKKRKVKMNINVGGNIQVSSDIYTIMSASIIKQ